MMITINITGIKDNLQHIAGLIVGTVSKKVYTKADRGTKWFSTAAANQAKEGFYKLLPYKMLSI